MKSVGTAAALAFVLLAGGLWAPGVDGQVTDDEIVLRVAMQDDVKTLNPLVAGDVWTWNVLGYLYDTPTNVDLLNPEKFISYIATYADNHTADSLFNFDDPATLDPTELAKSPIGKVCTVHYNFTGVKFHDNHAMDINDILFSFGVQALIPDWVASARCLMDQGGSQTSNHTTTHWLAIKKVDETTLRFYLQVPYTDFVRKTLSVFILPQHIWSMRVAGQDVDGSNPFLPANHTQVWKPAKALSYDNPNPVGSGPFRFVEWEPGQYAKIETWREHFYRMQPRIDGIFFKIYKTTNQAVQALQMGDIDYIAWSIPPTYIPDLTNDENISIAQNTEKGFSYLSYDMRKKSFGYDQNGTDVGKPLRLAIAHCISKKEIVNRLLQTFGIVGIGPICQNDKEWFNESLMDYPFNPEMAKRILQDAGYKLTNPGAPPGKGNWWLNPDGSPIGGSEGGKIEIATPPTDYDLYYTNPGIMIATQLQEIGIYAESIALDFGTIIQIIEARHDFDMYMLGWRIGADPIDFMYSFFHSDNAESGDNYVGYHNVTYDAIIDKARATDDPVLQKKLIKDAQAAIVLDQPYNVLYFRTNVEVYRSDRFVNWTVGNTGSIFCWRSIVGIHPPSPYKLRAQISVESPVASEEETNFIVTVKDQDMVPVLGAHVMIACTNGTFANGLMTANGTTLANGQFIIRWTAPMVPANSNETHVVINLISATKSHTPNIYPYDPAPSKIAYVTVKPEGVEFMRMRMDVDNDVLDCGSATDVTVSVTDQDSNPVVGASVQCEWDVAGVSVTGDSTTNNAGVARIVFKTPESLTKSVEITLTVRISHPNFVSDVTQITSITVLGYPPPPQLLSKADDIPLIVGSITIASLACIATLIVLARRKKHK